MDQTTLEAIVGDLDFGVEKSMRYHQRRRGFYDFFHKTFMFLIVVAGSAAFSGLSGMFAAVAAVLASIDLVWGLSHRARDHEVLFRRFSDLAIRIRTEEQTEASYRVWMGERVSIEKDEPPIYWALEADCDNEVRRARSKDAELVKIGWWCRKTMYFIRHAERTFKPVLG